MLLLRYCLLERDFSLSLELCWAFALVEAVTAWGVVDEVALRLLNILEKTVRPSESFCFVEDDDEGFAVKGGAVAEVGTKAG